MEVVLDSGSTYTYLPGDLYTQLKASLSKSLKQVSDASLPLCWKGPRPFKSVDDLKKEFKPKVSLKFGSGVTMAIPHENYLVITVSTRNIGLYSAVGSASTMRACRAGGWRTSDASCRGASGRRAGHAGERGELRAASARVLHRPHAGARDPPPLRAGAECSPAARRAAVGERRGRIEVRRCYRGTRKKEADLAGCGLAKEASQEHGNACFGILALQGLDIYLIGEITMQDQLMIYDNEKGRIGWMPSPCDKMPKSKAVIVSRI